ncbi:LOW QUALITY PROTEIN: E3 ubiquitin-protein ligase Topors-like [Python bivittatus]|uniref:RING-type E3 ubiquitin transferase n=1 Tax=Python bivittatus TaxID=176946 RepID=A0A9F5IYV6_PYTBI|nr:LOW QUALITY PROTEIN: E3 ubiquitin-protein ligase Topors-like [Python bivittatus]
MRHLQKEFKPRVGSRSSSRGSLVKTMQPGMTKNSKCAICLAVIQDPTYLNPCNHQFCFKCIQKWSRKKVKCPMCKQRFYSFFHTIRRKDAFCEYVLPLNNGSFPHSESNEDYTSASSQRLTSPPDNGILHNEISGTLTQREKDIYQLMRQFAVTERPSNIDLISLGKFKAQAVIQFRRTLYHTGILVQNATNPDFSQIPSAEFFSRNPGCLDRLIPWLKRELKVLCGNQRSVIHTLQNFILSNLTHHDLDSKEFEAVLQPHLHHFTGHFLHEFINFVQSSLNLKKYDWYALYECPAILKEEPDVLTSSPSSDDEHLQLPENGQVPKPNGSLDDRNLTCVLSGSEKDLPATFATADDKKHSKNEENCTDDLSKQDTERGIAPAYDIIKSKLLESPPREKVQPPGSLSHSHLFQGQQEIEDILEIEPVQILRPKNIETCKHSQTELSFRDDHTFNFYHKNSANIITMKNVNKKDITKCQPSEFPINKLKDYSSGWPKTPSPKRMSVHQNSGSKGSIECKSEEIHSASKERQGGRSKTKYPHDEKKCTNYSRDRRHRRDQRKSKSKEVSLFHKSPLLLRKNSTEARDTPKPKSQNTHHIRKIRNKDCDYLRNKSSSEPNWNYLYTRFKNEEPPCRKSESDRLCGSNPSTGSREKPYFSPENKILVNQRHLTKHW